MKPEDFDAIVYGETRRVLVEKTEEVSLYFHLKMLRYSSDVILNLSLVLESVAIHKEKLDS